jgi:hypothetical protein
MCVDITCHSKEGAAAKFTRLENKERPHEHTSRPSLFTGVPRLELLNASLIEYVQQSVAKGEGAKKHDYLTFSVYINPILPPGSIRNCLEHSPYKATKVFSIN